MKRYDGIIDEVLYYSEKSEDGRWIIPIEVDWDYTLTKCSSWETGEMVLNHEAFDIMKEWTDKYNVGWILNSMRTNHLLKEPLEILHKEGVRLYGVRKNPMQYTDGSSDEVNKVFAVMCIDDRNVCTPHEWYEDCTRPHVNWKAVNERMSPVLAYMSEQLTQREANKTHN